MKEQLIAIFKRTFEIENVNESVSRNNVDKWDSIGHLVLISELECKFSIKIEPYEIEKMKDFESVYQIVNLKVNKDREKDVTHNFLENENSENISIQKINIFFKTRKLFLRRIYRSYLLTPKFRIKILRWMGYKIGKNSYIGEGLFVSDRSIDSNNIIIGDRVDISGNVSFVTTYCPILSNWKKVYKIIYDPIVI